MREKKAQESTLAIEYKLSVEYLQQFLPDNDYFQYIYFDMAKLNKTWVLYSESVMSCLRTQNTPSEYLVTKETWWESCMI